MPSHGPCSSQSGVRGVTICLGLAILCTASPGTTNSLNIPCQPMFSKMAATGTELCCPTSSCHDQHTTNAERLSLRHHDGPLDETIASTVESLKFFSNRRIHGLRGSLAPGLFRVLQLRGAGGGDAEPGSSELEDEYLLSGLDDVDVDPDDGVTSSLPEEALK
jgi:hypothetical protein